MVIFYSEALPVFEKSDLLMNVCHHEMTKHGGICRLMTEVIAVCVLFRLTESKIAAQTNLVFPFFFFSKNLFRARINKRKDD